MNCSTARSSITLSDRQGIIDIPHCYLLTSVSSWVYFRLAGTKSRQLQHRGKKSAAQISPKRLEMERELKSLLIPSFMPHFSCSDSNFSVRVWFLLLSMLRLCRWTFDHNGWILMNEFNLKKKWSPEINSRSRLFHCVAWMCTAATHVRSLE